MHRLSASENQDGAVALAPGVPVAVAKPRRTINPIFPILCLGLVLFLIAATIVLALIPVYVSRRNIEPVDPGTAQFAANITLRNGSLPIGPLSSENCARIQNIIREQAAASSNVRPSVPTVTSCEVIGNGTTSSGRKKRQSPTTAVGNIIQIVVVLSPGNCFVNSCVVRRAQALIFILLNLGDFVLNLIINGSNVGFIAAFTSASSVIPVTTVSPSQTTTVSPSQTTTVATAVGNNPNVTFLGVTNDSRLLVFNALNSSAVVATIPIRNVLSGDIISNIDFRPATGELYGTANRQLYAINLNTGIARPIGGTLDSSVRGNIASMEFDPVYDVLRYVTDQGDRVTVDPEFGTLFYPTNLVNGTDKIISVGYANNLAGSSKSDLYGINITEDALYRVDFNNNGTITKVGSGLGVSVDDGIGFDISPEGIGIACVQIGSEQVVFSVDLTAGTFSKRLGVVTQPILSLAIPTAPVGYAVLKTNSSLVFANLIGSEFKYNYKTITGLQTNETIYSIDIRPFNGQLFGLGSSNRLYTFDLGTAEAYFPSNGNPLSPTLRGTNFAIDFNPQVDRIRVVSNQGQNLVLNPDTGDVQSVSTDLNPANITITNIAYSNNVANATNTTLFDISAVLNQLFTQNPPNNGTLNSVGPLGITVQEDHGFDITSLSNTAVALLTVGGKVNLYEINQNTGVATLLPYSVNLSDVKSFALGFNL